MSPGARDTGGATAGASTRVSGAPWGGPSSCFCDSGAGSRDEEVDADPVSAEAFTCSCS